jgi:hypothetical protein
VNNLALGIFALYMMVVSLLRVAADREHPQLTVMKKKWGRSRGLQLHFAANVALPLLVGIVFMTRGVVGIAGDDIVRAYDPVPQNRIYHHIAGTSLPELTIPAPVNSDRDIAEKKGSIRVIESAPYPRMTLS